MSPSYRNHKNKGLEEFISVDRKPNGAVYFSYRMPNGKKKSIRRPAGASDDAYRIHANQLARKLNHQLGRDKSEEDAQAILNSYVLANDGRSKTDALIPEILERFKKEYLPTKRLSVSTLEEKLRICRVYAALWPNLSLYDLNLRLLTQQLDSLAPSAYIKHRGVWNDIFKYTISKGMPVENLALKTLVKPMGRKMRKRLTLAGYRGIYAAAPSWLQRAMKLGLMTLQRRSDLVELTFDDIYEANLYPDYEVRFKTTKKGAELILFDLVGYNWIHPMRQDVTLVAKTSHRKATQEAIELNRLHGVTGNRHLIVIQDKTAKHGAKACLDIELTAEMEALISECTASEIHSPFLVHYKPEKLTEKTRAAKGHWSAVTAGYVSRAFSGIRDTLPEFQAMTEAERPTWHELRSLGGDLYLQQGFDKAFVNMLMGHTSEKMTQKYLNGHRVEFSAAKAGLKI